MNAHYNIIKTCATCTRPFGIAVFASSTNEARELAKGKVKRCPWCIEQEHERDDRHHASQQPAAP